MLSERRIRRRGRRPDHQDGLHAPARRPTATARAIFTIEPLETGFRVRFRIDGVLQEMPSPPKKLHSAIISRLKIMSGIDEHRREAPPAGRPHPGQARQQGVLDLRVSSIPTVHGESIVMRILDKTVARAGSARSRLPLGRPAEIRAADQSSRRHSCSSRAPRARARRRRFTRALHYDQQTGPQDHHGRGAGRVPAERHQPGAGELPTSA